MIGRPNNNRITKATMESIKIGLFVAPPSLHALLNSLYIVDLTVDLDHNSSFAAEKRGLVVRKNNMQCKSTRQERRIRQHRANKVKVPLLL